MDVYFGERRQRRSSSPTAASAAIGRAPGEPWTQPLPTVPGTPETQAPLTQSPIGQSDETVQPHPSPLQVPLGQASGPLCSHCPVPLHTEIAPSSPFTHAPPEQIFSLPGKVQAFALEPVHVPWQTPKPLQDGRPPCGAPVTVVQVPRRPATSQASHCPLQARSQQTESTHWLFTHSPSREQLSPPVRSGWQIPAEQKALAPQSESLAQDPSQMPPRHCFGSQDCQLAPEHVPWPSQAPATVAS